MRAVLSPHDLTHVQFVLLASLWWLEEHGDGPPSQAFLAAHAGTDAMMTSQVIRKLEGRELVARAPDPVDARARRLGLTPTGRTLAIRALADVEAADQAYFAALGDRLGEFTRALEALPEE
ncbi:MAG: MarR family winged helix-turn-helix transcriptional regulator [Solirubrobacteraceae bacterium]